MTLAESFPALQSLVGVQVSGQVGADTGLIGRLLLCVAILVCIELSLILGYWCLYKRGIAPRAIVANIGSGSCLLGALWAAIVLQSHALMLCLLLLSLCFHIADLATRWQS